MGNIFGIVIVRPFGIIMSAIYKAVGSYGLAVILFALLAKVILLPLSYKNKKSMKKMTALSAKQQALQKKYAKNREKLNEEIQKLYAEEGVSPMSGCLTSFIQLPIMMGLYYVVQQPLKFMIGLGDENIQLLANLVGVELTAQNSYTAQLAIAEGLNNFLDGAGGFVEAVTSLSPEIKSYLVPINFDFLGLNLSQTPSFTHPSILWLIPILSGLTAFLSSWIMQKLQNNGQQMQGSMKAMLYTMPLMSVYFGFTLPSAIGIYWVTNNVLSVVQELILNMIVKDEKPAEPETKAKKKKAKALEQGETAKKEES